MVIQLLNLQYNLSCVIDQCLYSSPCFFPFRCSPYSNANTSATTTLLKGILFGLSDPAPTGAPSKKSCSGISWMGWNCPPVDSLLGQYFIFFLLLLFFPSSVFFFFFGPPMTPSFFFWGSSYLLQPTYLLIVLTPSPPFSFWTRFHWQRFCARESWISSELLER
jgi:hypothetical protein